MRIISFIDLSACNAQAGQPGVIQKILEDLGLLSLLLLSLRGAGDSGSCVQ